MRCSMFFAILVSSVLIFGSVLSSQAIMGLGECERDCDGDKECIRDCRQQFRDPDEVKEMYKQEFRDCFDGCYELRGKEKEECLQECRDDYKTGRELPNR